MNEIVKTHLGKLSDILFKIEEVVNSFDSLLNENDFNKPNYFYSYNEVLESLSEIKSDLLNLNILDEIKILYSKDYSQITDQYEKFIKTEILSNENNNLEEFDKHYLNYKKQITFDNDESIEHYKRIVEEFNEIFFVFYEIKNQIEAMLLLDKVKDIKNNIVLVGTNGSGKTTYVREISNHMENMAVTIISSQHYLKYENITFEYDSGEENWKRLQKRDKGSLDNDDYQNEMSTMMNMLMENYIENAFSYYQGYSKEVSKLEEVINQWQKYFPNIQMQITKDKIYPLSKDGIKYDFNDMSDGEKNTFYYIGQVLTSEANSIIFIDEPENHMNVGLSKRLWNDLELYREDCQFVYITHDLDFTGSRINATILWNKKFTTSINWEVERISSNNNLPKELLIDIAGEQSKILFCEGTENSLDQKLYSILFPEYLIMPVVGHMDVINYYNVYSKKNNFAIKAIIDRDWHDDKWISKYQKKKDFTVLNTVEIENILCDLKVIKAVIYDMYGDDSEINADKLINKYLDEFWKLYDLKKKEQAKKFVIFQLNTTIKGDLLSGEKETLNAISEKIQNISTLSNLENIENKRIETLEDILTSKNYERALKEVDFKKEMINKLKTIVTNNYELVAINSIRKSEEIKKYIVEQYLTENNGPISRVGGK